MQLRTILLDTSQEVLGYRISHNGYYYDVPEEVVSGDKLINKLKDHLRKQKRLNTLTLHLVGGKYMTADEINGFTKVSEIPEGEMEFFIKLLRQSAGNL